MDLRSSTTVTAGVPVVSFEGSIDLSTLTRLRDPLLRAVADQPGGRVVADLDGVDLLDDTGLGILLGTAARARDEGGDVVVVVTSPQVRRRFAISRFDRAIELFSSIAAATADRSAGPVFHIALPADVAAVGAEGTYATSTRGRSLEEEGFIHCSFAHQVDATLTTFYADVDEVVVLRIDPEPLGDLLVVEDLYGTGEPFPHLYGPLPMSAVIGTEHRRLR